MEKKEAIFFEKRYEDLEIISDNKDELSELVNHQLYEANFTTGLKFIFRSMLDKKNKEADKDENSQSDWMLREDHSNILSFIGGRGAGKTTSMKEFCRILDDMNGTGNEKRKLWLENVLESNDEIDTLSKSSMKFHILKMVDAGLLNESEDLIERILVSLYREHEEQTKNNRSLSRGFQPIMLEIEQLFEDLLAMYSSTRKNNVFDEDYTLATISRRTGDSAVMHEKISELLSAMKVVQQDRVEHEYYVIAIDDLDLNLRHGYEMLEQVQKYFSDERILILITMDYEQLCNVCMENFHKEMPFTDKVASENSMKRSQILATDMMTKVFPLAQRIFLPDVKKQGKQLRVVVEKYPLQTRTVKKYIMEKVAYCMRIYYDAKGTKRHFIEPDTIRQLVFYNNFLDSLYWIDFSKMKTWPEIEAMDDGDEKEKNKECNKLCMVEYANNHHRFNDDISKRQVQVMLTIPHRQAFKTFLEFDLSRRAVYFVNSKIDYSNIIFTDLTLEARRNYSYADLVEKIYESGRSNYEYKPFISCVLASFTSEMVREYINYRYNPSEKKRKVSEERLCRFMGKTFGNAWLGEYINVQKKPVESWTEFSYGSGFQSTKEMFDNQGFETESIGFVQKAITQNVSMRFDIDVLKHEKSKSVHTGKNNRKACLEKWLDKNQLIPIIECVDMFLVRTDIPEESIPNYDGVNFSISLEYPTDSNGENDGDDTDVKQIVLRFNGDCMMDVFGFIPKSLNYKRRKNVVEQNIIYKLAETLCIYFEGSPMEAGKETIRKEIETIVRKQSIFKLVETEPVRNEVAFPFYDLDMSYNVIKRLRAELIDLQSDDFCGYILKICDTIEILLKDEAAEYEDVGFSYDEVFDKCAYVEALRQLNKSDDAKNKITEYINDLTGWTTSLYNPLDAAD